MTGEVVLRLGFGLGLGAASSMLPGPCYLAVLTAARRGRARALATGLGAALGDLSYAALGVTGAGLALARPPAVTQALQLAGGLGMIVYGLAHARARAVASPGAPTRSSPRTSVGGGVATGLSTVLVNPGALVTWTLLTGATLAGDPSAARWAGVLGIGLGSFASYAAVGHWGGASGRVSQVTAVVSRLLVVAGALTLARVARGWLSS